MKIKTIERIINLKDLENLIINIIQLDFEINFQSSNNENFFYLDAMDEKMRNLKIGAYNDFEFNRTIIIILVLKIGKLSENKNFFFEFDDKNQIQNFFQFINPKDITLCSRRTNIKFNQIERELIHKLLEEINVKFNYKDKLMKYPFSLTTKFDFNQYWMDSSNQYLNTIERNLLQKGIRRSDLFRYYDFSKNSEICQRIIDLIAIAEKLTKEGEENLIHILFFYVNKTQKKFKLLKFVKLFGEIKKYCNLLEIKLKNKEKKIRPYLIIISSYGFEKPLMNYLNTHIYKEFEHIITIFTVSLVNGKIFHNICEDTSILDDLENTKEKIVLNLKRFRNISNPAPYRRDQIRSESKRLTEVKDKISAMRKNSNIISFFSEIISIQDFKKVTDTNKNLKLD